ncbi:MAG: hypothetical protein HYV26_15030 [Candidatus Hydrogenedentes bacterium]|nr:hypothetical protein [Candidatus Hydrogenedentota bacterium]
MKKSARDRAKLEQGVEQRLPELSGRAFAAARQKALDAGETVLEAREGALYRVHPNGTFEIVKTIAPPRPVTRGARITLR